MDLEFFLIFSTSSKVFGRGKPRGSGEKCSAVQCSIHTATTAVQYCAVQCSAVQCSAKIILPLQCSTWKEQSTEASQDSEPSEKTERHVPRNGDRDIKEHRNIQEPRNA